MGPNVYHRDNVSHAKPDPRAFDWLWQKGFTPEQCVFVGDSILDGQAAHGAGMKFVATLESGIHDEDYFSGVEVAAFIKSFGELAEIL